MLQQVGLQTSYWKFICFDEIAHKTVTGTRPQSDCKCSYLLAKTSLLWPPKVTSPDFSFWFISSSFVSVCKHTTMSSSLSALLAECHFWAIKFPELLLRIARDTCPASARAAHGEMAREWAKAHPHATSESQLGAGMPCRLQKCCESGAYKAFKSSPRRISIFWTGKRNLRAWGTSWCLGF